MNYPMRPTENMWQLAGQGFNQAAGITGGLKTALDEEEQRRNVLQELVERRTQAELERQRREREMKMKEAAFAQDQEVYKREKDEKDRSEKSMSEFRKAAGEDGAPREGLQKKALTLGVYSNPDVKAYMDDTKPATGLSLEDRLAMIAAQGMNKPQASTKWQVSEVNGRKVQVNPETGEQRDLGPITPKPSGKDLTTAKVKLQSLSLARQQIQNMRKAFEGIKGSFSAGPGGGFIPTPSGKSFDAAVDGFRTTLTGLTRVPGVGAQSDFEAKLTQAPLPNRSDYEDVMNQKMNQLEQLVNTLESGYSGMLESGGEPPIEVAPASKALAPRDKQAILWAKKNPGSPQAQAILKLHGMQ